MRQNPTKSVVATTSAVMGPPVSSVVFWAEDVTIVVGEAVVGDAGDGNLVGVADGARDGE